MLHMECDQWADIIAVVSTVSLICRMTVGGHYISCEQQIHFVQRWAFKIIIFFTAIFFDVFQMRPLQPHYDVVAQIKNNNNAAKICMISYSLQV